MKFPALTLNSDIFIYGTDISASTHHATRV